MWWNNAKGRYNIGHRPARNSVLVFQRTKAMSAGHVAVVREVVNRRTILIEHANWAPRNGMKGRVSTELVEDISPNNDWTSVRVMHKPSMSFGKPYATNGFIHPRLAGSCGGTLSRLPAASESSSPLHLNHKRRSDGTGMPQGMARPTAFPDPSTILMAIYLCHFWVVCL